MVKLNSRKLVPVLLWAGVAGIVALGQAIMNRDEDTGFARRLEWMTYDWRARMALKHPLAHAPNLGFVFINDETIDRVLSGQFGYKAGLYWPRHVYGRLVQELSDQRAEAIAFDVLFAELRPDHPPIERPDGKQESSDEYFARQIRRAGNVILAAVKDTVPPKTFLTNAWAIGDIAATRDVDGILRRSKAFEDYVIWHPAIREAAGKFDDFGFNTNRLTFRSADGITTQIPITPDGMFDLATLLELGNGTKFSPGVRRLAKAYSRQRAWDLGLTAAARYLGIDLASALVEPGKRIVMRDRNRLERTIPIDQNGRFYIDWSLTYGDRADGRLTSEAAHSVLDQQRRRELGLTNELKNLWRDKLAIIGSVTSGNDLTDYGATPVEKETHLTSRYWNIANSLILDRFIQRPRLATELCFIAGLSLLAGTLTWRLRSLIAALCVLLLAFVYVAIGVYLYVQVRYWLPIVLPCGALFLTHFTLISYRAVFEQREGRRIRGIFAKIVSPNIVHELLKAEKLALGGARREVTVFFADVRGFTEMTDESHARAENHVREQKLDGLLAEAYFDEQAQEILRTVNLYLGTIADTVKQREGTLDKYIGDCVMAFWGAPTPNTKHALSCVQAAIDAQRAIHSLNQKRALENQFREQNNLERSALGQPPVPLLKLLSMGSGINTGIVTVGLMGSEQHTFNYTVFGREVNLASRLEGLSGRGRILIGETTYRALLKDDPQLAASCQELAPTTPKGFRTPVRIFEVPWRLTIPTPPAPSPARSANEAGSTVTPIQ
jgi:class 3 adenylate cyclase/CHASE2 domain-containing sensor protein